MRILVLAIYVILHPQRSKLLNFWRDLEDLPLMLVFMTRVPVNC